MNTELQVIKHNEGEGETVPYGANVSVHYTGTLMNGQQFDSSQGGDPIDFDLGYGQVIKGWDEGIQQLKKGQKATIICPPDYAYGKRGSPPVIPPYAVLKFEVEVVDFTVQKSNPCTDYCSIY